MASSSPPAASKRVKKLRVSFTTMPESATSAVSYTHLKHGLAKILNYNFIDADLVIQNQCDKTLQKLIDACGPEGFIQVENQILSDLTAERSIIATGGSAVYSLSLIHIWCRAGAP